MVAAGRGQLAQRKLIALTELIRPARQVYPPDARRASVEFGFNEWLRAQDGTPQGEDWQSWSAAMYLYAAACVENGHTPFLHELRAASPLPSQG